MSRIVRVPARQLGRVVVRAITATGDLGPSATARFKATRAAPSLVKPFRKARPRR
jgi:hypothetical protein